MKKTALQMFLLFFISFSAFAQSASSAFFEFSGKEITISELPLTKGRWFNPLNKASNQFRFEYGILYIWNGGKCGEDQRKITKAFKDGSVYLLEVGGTKDPIRCQAYDGAYYKFDTTVKTGEYHIKATKDTLEILRSGTLELE
jgi:hypothetical protein